jgi:hypothetical protein
VCLTENITAVCFDKGKRHAHIIKTTSRKATHMDMSRQVVPVPVVHHELPAQREQKFLKRQRWALAEHGAGEATGARKEERPRENGRVRFGRLQEPIPRSRRS